MIIGVSGTLASGKDIAAKYFIEKRFQHISLSDTLREMMKKEGLPLDRDSMRNFANRELKKNGAGFLAKMAIDRKNEENLVISSVRGSAEVDYLGQREDFKLLFVDAPVELRYQRMKERKRAGEENLTLEEFIQDEEAERSGSGSQNLDYCKKHADYTIINDGTIAAYYGKLDKIVRELSQKS